MHLFGKFLTSNFLHSVSVPAAFTPRYITLSEFIIFSLSLTHPFRRYLPLFLPHAVFFLPLSTPCRSHLIISFSFHALMSSLLRLSHSLCPEINTSPMTNSLLLPFSPESDTVFLSSCNSFDLLHITNRNFSYLHIASFCLCFCLSHFFLHRRYLCLCGCRK